MRRRHPKRRGAALWVAITAGAVTLAAADGGPWFVSPTSIPVGPGLPTSILTPDLNGDGRHDVVLTHYETYLATPMLNNGDGTFTMLPAADTGERPQGALAADANGDSRIDLIVLGLESDYARFLRGRGDGSFDDAGEPIFVEHDPVALDGGDFNEDGRLDLAVARSPERGGGLTVVLGNGDGTFGLPVLNELLPDFGIAVAVADLDENGHDDIVASHSQTSFGLYFGRGDGTFSERREIVTGTRNSVIRPVDIDQDGHLDLFLVQANQDRIAFLRGRGDGTFADPIYSDAGETPAYSTLADLNHDGALDVVVQSIVSFDVRILLGDGRGHFATPRSFAAVGRAQLVTHLDVDGDSIDEVVAATAPGGTASLSIFQVLDDASLAAARNLPGNVAGAGVIGDVDDDGRPDLIVAMPNMSQVGVYLDVRNAAAPVLSPPLPFPVGRLAVADFDADGKTDLLAAAAINRNAAWLRGNGDGSFAVAGTLTPASGGGFVAILATDYDRDGEEDAVLVQADGKIVSLRGHGNGSFDEAMTTQGPTTTAATLGNFNADPWPDILTFDVRQRRLAIFLGDGTGSFGAGPTVAAAQQVPGVTTADFDADGYDDIVIVDGTNRQALLLPNAGNGQFGTPVPFSPGAEQMSLAICDIDASAGPDILVGSRNVGVVQPFLYEGQLSSQTPVGVAQKPVATFCADFDGDGRYDLATINDTNGTPATWARSLGGGASLRGDGNGDRSLGAADLTALVRELQDGVMQRIDTRERGYRAAAGIDADGDAWVTRRDLSATVHRMFR